MAIMKNGLAIITGGSSGIGKSLARVLHRDGLDVVLVARTRQTLEAARKEIESISGGGGTVGIAVADVTDQVTTSRAVQQVVDEHGAPDYLFNCAGKAVPGLVEQFTASDFEAAMRLDYLGTVIPTLAVLPRMLARGKGHVVNISSVAGFIGLVGYATYAPAKFAVIGLSEVLRHELKPKGISVSVACPPDVDTPGFHEENKHKPEACRIISERGKVMQPADVAAAIWTGVKKGKFMIVPGEASFMYTMKRLFPSLVYKTLDADLKKAMEQLGKT